MNTHKDTQEQIDRYLMGQMDQLEKRTFEQELENDQELQQAVRLNRHIINALHIENAQTAFDAMKEMSQEEIKNILTSTYSKKPTKSFSLIRISVAVAATILILIYIGYRPKYSAKQLFDNYYVTQSYESYPSRGDSELTVDERVQLQQAKKLYQQKQYAQALGVYNQFLINAPDWKALPEEILFIR